MAPSTTLIPFSPHAEGARAALDQWLGRVASALQVRACLSDGDPAGDPAGAARARILRQAGMTMLAPVEPGARALRALLR